MLSATKRLEGKQAEKYRPSVQKSASEVQDTAAYDEYLKSSNALIPRLL